MFQSRRLQISGGGGIAAFKQRQPAASSSAPLGFGKRGRRVDVTALESTLSN